MKPGTDYTGVTTAFYCTDGSGRFLFHKRSESCRDEHGKWDCGGGKLEFGCSLKENVLREVQEEYGCPGKILKQLPAHSMHREWKGKALHWVAISFIVLIKASEARNNEPEKICEIGWFELDNLPSPLHPAVKKEVKDSLEVFKKYSK